MSNPESMFDMGEDAPAEDSLKKLTDLCENAVAIQAAIESYDAAMKQAKSTLWQMETKDIPDLMAECKMQKFVLSTGHEVGIKLDVRGNIPKSDNRRKSALSYLEQIGGSGIIKTQLASSFMKGEIEKARALMKLLASEEFAEFARSSGDPALEEFSAPDMEVKEDVHVQSLWAFVREVLGRGDDIDVEQLGVTAENKSFLKAPKPNKGES